MWQNIFTQVRTLFIIPNPVAPHGISEETIFETRTKGEIGDIKWFPLRRRSFEGSDFFTVRPFIEDIISWVSIFGQHQATYIKDCQMKEESNVERAISKGQSKKESDRNMKIVEKVKGRDSGVVLEEDDEGNPDADAEARIREVEAQETGAAGIDAASAPLPLEFLPQAWASFHLDHQHLHQLALGEDWMADMEQGVNRASVPKLKARLRLQG